MHVMDAASRDAGAPRRNATLGAVGPLPLPPAPRNLIETGLPQAFLVDLTLKMLAQRGSLSLQDLAWQIHLPRGVLGPVVDFVRNERLAEIGRGGMPELDAQYQLTDKGHARAVEAARRCSYTGPAPVPLELYQAIVTAQAVSNERFEAIDVRHALADVVLDPELVDRIGAAMNSGRAMLLYGPPGSGKTYIAELLARLARGSIAVPYALFVGGEIVQVYDPIFHEAIEQAGPIGLLERTHDRRWQVCRRPMIVSGGELTLAMLDLQFDEQTRFYQAPPHMKANGGIYVVDDLGRQLVSPRDLMNRWIVPLDRRRDYLSLHNGFKFSVPFEMTVVFSTNLQPAQLADEAFLRRFGYKILVGPVDPGSYRTLFERVCDELGVRFDAQGLEWLLRERHHRTGRALLACYPRDLIGRVRDLAVYQREPAEMSEESLARAWSVYFIHEQCGEGELEVGGVGTVPV